MKIPTDAFLSSIEEKKVYYFSSTQINTNIPHYFICIKRSPNDILVMSCCTSQYNTVKNFVEKRNLPTKTLVWISPKDSQNPFDVDTYVNCNSSFIYTIEEFRSMYESDSIKYTGEISETHYEQILIGLHASPLIDEETKEIIPQAN